MRQLLVLTLVALSLACVQKPAPVAEMNPVAPGERPAIDVQYVAVPTMIVYAQPAAGAPQTGSYGLSEAISILERKGEWSMIRTFDGTGWVKSADLVTGEQMEKAAADKTPRFYVAPAAVPFTGRRGEIILQAKVNTDGDVVEVTTMKNTTGSKEAADANAEALMAAKFYPMVEKLSRKSFTYEHHVYY